METFDIEDYIDERLSKQLEWYELQALKNKKVYKLLQGGLIICSALTPVFIAIDLCNINFAYIGWFPIITSVLVAIFASFLQTFRFYEKWINYRAVAELIKHEKYLFLSKSGIYSGNDSFNVFVENIESIILSEHSNWLSKQNEDISSYTLT